MKGCYPSCLRNGALMLVKLLFWKPRALVKFLSLKKLPCPLVVPFSVNPAGEHTLSG